MSKDKPTNTSKDANLSLDVGEKVGMVIGTSTTKEITIALYPEKLKTVIKLDEFLSVFIEVDNSEREVIGILRSIMAENEYLLEHLSYDPNLGERLTSVIPRGEGQRVIGILEILGYVDTETGGLQLKRSRIPPQPTTSVYLTSDPVLQKIFSRGHIRIGHLVVRENVPVMIDIQRLATRHFAVLAVTGAGKSNTIAILVRALVLSLQASIVIIDPHNDYITLRNDPSPISKYVKVFQSEGSDGHLLRFRLDSFSDDEIAEMLGLPENAKNLRGKLYDVMDFTRKKYSSGFTLNNIEEVTKEMQMPIGEKGSSAYNSQLMNLRQRIKQIPAKDLYSDHFETPINGIPLGSTGIVGPKQLSIISLAGLQERIQQVIVARVLKRIFDAGVNYRHRIHDDREILPCPTIVIIEEAHRFASATEYVISIDEIKKIASEGRKFGIGLGLISQRPGRLHPDVLSQCNSQIILRITNPRDQNQIADSAEAVSEEILEKLPGLNDGQAIIIGSIVNVSALTQIDKYDGDLGGQDLDIIKRWNEATVESTTKKNLPPSIDKDGDALW